MGFRGAETVRSQNVRARTWRIVRAMHRQPRSSPHRRACACTLTRGGTLWQLLLALGRAERHDETNGKCCDDGQHHAAPRRAPLLPHASATGKTAVSSAHLPHPPPAEPAQSRVLELSTSSFMTRKRCAATASIVSTTPHPHCERPERRWALGGPARRQQRLRNSRASGRAQGAYFFGRPIGRTDAHSVMAVPADFHRSSAFGMQKL